MLKYILGKKLELETLFELFDQTMASYYGLERKNIVLEKRMFCL